MGDHLNKNPQPMLTPESLTNAFQLRRRQNTESPTTSRQLGQINRILGGHEGKENLGQRATLDQPRFLEETFRDTSSLDHGDNGYNGYKEELLRPAAKSLLGDWFQKSGQGGFPTTFGLGLVDIGKAPRERVMSNRSQRSLKDPNRPQAQEIKLSDCFRLLKVRTEFPDSSSFAVIKVSNITWEITGSDIRKYFEPLEIPHAHQAPFFAECVHIILSRSSGKILPYCFVEFPTIELARVALSDEYFFKKRSFKLELSSQEELFRALFPNYRVQVSDSSIQSGTIFLQREETLKILTACKNIKSRSPSKLKGVERPFENIISVLSKLQGKGSDISSMHRDHLFEMVKIAIETIVSADRPKEHASLISRVVRAGVCLHLFTEKQKLILLSTANIQCPKELVAFVYYPDPEDDSEGSNAKANVAKDLRLSEQTPSPSSTARSEELTMAKYQTLSDRTSQADKLMTVLRQDQYLLSTKYHEVQYELVKVQERFEKLKQDYEHLETICYDYELRAKTDSLNIPIALGRAKSLELP